MFGKNSIRASTPREVRVEGLARPLFLRRGSYFDALRAYERAAVEAAGATFSTELRRLLSQLT